VLVREPGDAAVDLVIVHQRTNLVVLRDRALHFRAQGIIRVLGDAQGVAPDFLPCLRELVVGPREGRGDEYEVLHTNAPLIYNLQYTTRWSAWDQRIAGESAVMAGNAIIDAERREEHDKTGGSPGRN